MNFLKYYIQALLVYCYIFEGQYFLVFFGIISEQWTHVSWACFWIQFGIKFSLRSFGNDFVRSCFCQIWLGVYWCILVVFNDRIRSYWACVCFEFRFVYWDKAFFMLCWTLIFFLKSRFLFNLVLYLSCALKFVIVF